MDLFELLKQFKKITPSEDFTAKSKRTVLATTPREPLGIRRVFYHVIETGVAVALAGFFVFIITGGLSGSKVSPLQYSAIDPQSLHAEADAINMQIQLVSVNYQNALATATAAQAAMNGTTTTSTASSSGNATDSISIDQALQELSK